MLPVGERNCSEAFIEHVLPVFSEVCLSAGSQEIDYTWKLCGSVKQWSKMLGFDTDEIRRRIDTSLYTVMHSSAVRIKNDFLGCPEDRTTDWG